MVVGVGRGGWGWLKQNPEVTGLGAKSATNTRKLRTSPFLPLELKFLICKMNDQLGVPSLPFTSMTFETGMDIVR